MRTLRVAFSAVVLVACCALGAPVRAACSDHVLMMHLFDSYFSCDDGVQTAGYAYQQSDPLDVNTGTMAIACAAAPTDADTFFHCPASSGVFGDQRVTIGADWMD